MKFTKIGLMMRGAAMGVAEVIPGVSGGTIAFITGIYHELLNSIKAVDHHLLGMIVKLKFGKAFESVNGGFLLWLFAGMLGGILIGIFGVTYFLENYPEVLWSLFFGLILASIPLMLSQIKIKGPSNVGLFLIGALIAYGITSLSPTEGSTSYVYVYVAGAISISALVLPGISGSFMLLLLGLYTTIIPTIKEFLKSPELSEFLLLAVFGLGCLTGLTLFSRLVSAAFEKYHDLTIALLSGFMLGSLNKIWPWRNPQILLDKETNAFLDVSSANYSEYNLLSENIKVLKEQNVFPSTYYYEPRTILVIAAFIVGILLIYFLSKLNLNSPSE